MRYDSGRIGDMSLLQKLNLDNNQLSGTIPAELGNMGNSVGIDNNPRSVLTILNLYNNKLSGTIPPELENLSFLQILNLGKNDLIGSIPHALGMWGIRWTQTTTQCIAS